MNKFKREPRVGDQIKIKQKVLNYFFPDSNNRVVTIKRISGNGNIKSYWFELNREKMFVYINEFELLPNIFEMWAKS